MKMSEVYDLKWKKFHANASETFNNLRLEEAFTDVTLVSNDYSMIKAHKIVLSASSQYFNNLLKIIPASTPFICLDGVSSSELKFLIEYIYHGEIKVPHDSIKKFLLLAKRFLVKGLFNDNEIQKMKLFKMETHETKENEESKVEKSASEEKYGDKILQQNDGVSSHNSDPLIESDHVNTEIDLFEESSNRNEINDGQNYNETKENDIVEGVSIRNEEMKTFRSVEAVKVNSHKSINRKYKIYLDEMEVTPEFLNSKLNVMVSRTDFGYQCTECDYASHVLSHTKEHVEKHIKNLSFVCNLCSYQAKLRRTFRADSHTKKCGGKRSLGETWLIEKIQLKI